MIEFEWDEIKNKANREKHGISFENVRELFLSPTLTRIDSRKDYGEIRENSLGVVENIVLFVTHTTRNGKIRLISARRANREEREIYHEYIQRSRADEN
jgi:uncharacterized DUF497 family protein